MELTLRPLQNGDYEDILSHWWDSWGWEAPKKDFLPDNGNGGVIILDGETPVCAGFIYITNSKVAWVDWIISNKDYRKKPQRTQAIRMIVESLTGIARATENKYAYALIKNKPLINVYSDLGYTKGDEYVGEMIKAL